MANLQHSFKEVKSVQVFIWLTFVWITSCRQDSSIHSIHVCLYLCTINHKNIHIRLVLIAFWYKVQGHEEVTMAFIVTKLLKGAKRGEGTQDNRVPITLNILTKLFQALDMICVSSV